MMFFVKKTPNWSAWGTALFGLAFTALSKFVFHGQWASDTFGLDFTRREISDWNVILPILLCATLQPLFFYGTKYFYVDRNDEQAKELSIFLENQAKPVSADEHEECLDHLQGKMLGSLAGAYGIFVILIGAVVLIINLTKGNEITLMSIFSFLGVGGSVGGIGWILYHAYKPRKD